MGIHHQLRGEEARAAAMVLRTAASNARDRMDDGEGRDPETRVSDEYDKGWRDALDGMARYLDRRADAIVQGDRPVHGPIKPKE